MNKYNIHINAALVPRFNELLGREVVDIQELINQGKDLRLFSCARVPELTSEEELLIRLTFPKIWLRKCGLPTAMTEQDYYE